MVFLFVFVCIHHIEVTKPTEVSHILLFIGGIMAINDLLIFLITIFYYRQPSRDILELSEVPSKRHWSYYRQQLVLF